MSPPHPSSDHGHSSWPQTVAYSTATWGGGMSVDPQLIEGGRAQSPNRSIYSHPKWTSLCASSGYAWERTSQNCVHPKLEVRSELDRAACSVHKTLLAYWWRSAVRATVDQNTTSSCTPRSPPPPISLDSPCPRSRLATRRGWGSGPPTWRFRTSCTSRRRAPPRRREAPLTWEIAIAGAQSGYRSRSEARRRRRVRIATAFV